MLEMGDFSLSALSELNKSSFSGFMFFSFCLQFISFHLINQNRLVKYFNGMFKYYFDCVFLFTLLFNIVGILFI